MFSFPELPTIEVEIMCLLCNSIIFHNCISLTANIFSDTV